MRLAQAGFGLRHYIELEPPQSLAAGESRTVLSVEMSQLKSLSTRFSMSESYELDT